MKESQFYQMFLNSLYEIYDGENQIVKAMPQMIQMASHSELKDAFNKHLEETRTQIERLNKVFVILGENPNRLVCKSIQGVILEGQEINQKNYSPAVKDACLIIGAQKIEHLEIATYGSLCSIAEQLDEADFEDKVDFDEVIDLLEENLDEEASADKKLTSIAEGGLFKEGINEEAGRKAKVHRR